MLCVRTRTARMWEWYDENSFVPYDEDVTERLEKAHKLSGCTSKDCIFTCSRQNSMACTNTQMQATPPERSIETSGVCSYFISYYESVVDFPRRTCYGDGDVRFVFSLFSCALILSHDFFLILRFLEGVYMQKSAGGRPRKYSCDDERKAAYSRLRKEKKAY